MQVDLADVLQEELQRLGRDFALVDLGLLLGRLDDLDVQLLEPAVQLVDLRRLELELINRDGAARQMRAARTPGRSRSAPRRSPPPELVLSVPQFPLLHRLLPSRIRLVLDLVGHGASFQPPVPP